MDNKLSTAAVSYQLRQFHGNFKELMEQSQDKLSEETATGGAIGTDASKQATNLANSIEMKELVEQSQDKPSEEQETGIGGACGGAIGTKADNQASNSANSIEMKEQVEHSQDKPSEETQKNPEEISKNLGK